MAFPTVQDADTQAGTVVANDATWDLTYPTNLASGDLILAFLGTDGDLTSASFPANWLSEFGAAEGTTSIVWGKKSSLGTESGTFTVTLSGAEQGCWRVLRITGWEGTLGTDFTPGGSQGSVQAVTTASGSGTAPDPPSNNPNTWDVEDTLWIAVAASDHGNTTYTGFPSGYGNTSAQESGGAGGAALGTARLNSASASQDPGTFTTDASEGWHAQTIAIRPASSAPKSLLLHHYRNSRIIR